jgi:hypothetical protein
MRKLMLCLGLLGTMPIAYAATPLVGSPAASLSKDRTTVDINRNGKGDRVSLKASTLQAPRIVTVEVVGLEQAAVIYRDREGRVLFASDPVSNTTVMVRGVSLPTVTVRATSGAAVRPVVVEQPAAPAAKEPQPMVHEPKLPDGCEPAASPLSPSGKSVIKARCVS